MKVLFFLCFQLLWKYQLTSVFFRESDEEGIRKIEEDIRKIEEGIRNTEEDIRNTASLREPSELQLSKKRKRFEELLAWTRAPVDSAFTFSDEGSFYFMLSIVMFKYQLTCVFFRESAFVTL